jgi:hypothetical protein
MQVLAYHEAIRDEVRSSNLNTFLRPIRKAGSDSSGELPIVMVATDRLSRGRSNASFILAIHSAGCGSVFYSGM